MHDETFTVTAEHIALLRHAYVDWDDCEYGAPAISPKRPYGNSSVELDIVDILGWTYSDDDGPTTEQRDRAREIHEGTQYALQIFLVTGEMREGTYRLATSYQRRSWERVS